MWQAVKKGLGWINRGLIRLGELLGMVVTPVILFVFYVVIVMPVFLLLRVFSRDPLHLRWKKGETYWSRKEDFDVSPQRLRRPF